MICTDDAINATKMLIVSILKDLAPPVETETQSWGSWFKEKATNLLWPGSSSQVPPSSSSQVPPSTRKDPAQQKQIENLASDFEKGLCPEIAGMIRREDWFGIMEMQNAVDQQERDTYRQAMRLVFERRSDLGMSEQEVMGCMKIVLEHPTLGILQVVAPMIEDIPVGKDWALLVSKARSALSEEIKDAGYYGRNKYDTCTRIEASLNKAYATGAAWLEQNSADQDTVEDVVRVIMAIPRNKHTKQSFEVFGSLLQNTKVFEGRTELYRALDSHADEIFHYFERLQEELSTKKEARSKLKEANRLAEQRGEEPTGDEWGMSLRIGEMTSEIEKLSVLFRASGVDVPK